MNFVILFQLGFPISLIAIIVIPWVYIGRVCQMIPKHILWLFSKWVDEATDIQDSAAFFCELKWWVSSSTRKLRWSMGRTRIKVSSSISEVILLGSRDLWNRPSSALGAQRSLASLGILQPSLLYFSRGVTVAAARPLIRHMLRSLLDFLGPVCPFIYRQVMHFQSCRFFSRVDRMSIIKQIHSLPPSPMPLAKYFFSSWISRVRSSWSGSPALYKYKSTRAGGCWWKSEVQLWLRLVDADDVSNKPRT